MASHDHAAGSDLHIVLATGSAGWRIAGSHYSRAELATIAALLAFTAAVINVMLVSAASPGADAAAHGNARWAIAAVGATTLLIGVSPNLLWVIKRLAKPLRVKRLYAALRPSSLQDEDDRQQRTTSLVLHAAIRLAALGVVAGAWTALLGPFSPWPAWLLGGVVACEYTLTAWAVGERTTGFQWWWRVQRSSVHIGVVLVVAIAAVAKPERLGDLLLVPLTFQSIVLGGAVTCHLLEKLRQSFDVRQERTARAMADGVLHEVGLILHNRAITPLKLLGRRVASGQLNATGAKKELEAVIHDLRLMQLDGMIDSGTASLADVMSPFIRLCQNQDVDVDVTGVPPADELHVVMEVSEWKELRNALDVLVPNAIEAGATHITLRAAPLGKTGLIVDVEDDAGGFAFDETPPGRALDRLRRELGEDGFAQEPVPQGTRLSVTVGHGMNGAGRQPPSGPPRVATEGAGT